MPEINPERQPSYAEIDDLIAEASEENRRAAERRTAGQLRDQRLVFLDSPESRPFPEGLPVDHPALRQRQTGDGNKR